MLKLRPLCQNPSRCCQLNIQSKNVFGSWVCLSCHQKVRMLRLMKLFRIKDIPYVGFIDEDMETPIERHSVLEQHFIPSSPASGPPLSDAEALKRRENAMQHHDMAQITDAASVLSNLLDSNPNDTNANYNLGVLLHTCGWSGLAVKYLLKVVECSPEDSVAHSVLKYVYTFEAYASLIQ